MKKQQRRRRFDFVGTPDRLKVSAVYDQRNGITGRPFTAVYFTYDTHERMMAIVPNGDSNNDNGVEVFVVSLDRPEQAWRGDYYAPAILAHIASL